MFSILKNTTYTSKDWATMATAHEMASAMLLRDPRTHEHADRLARTVMKLFDRGLRDPKIIADQASEREASLIGLAKGDDGGNYEI